MDLRTAIKDASKESFRVVADAKKKLDADEKKALANLDGDGRRKYMVEKAKKKFNLDAIREKGTMITEYKDVAAVKAKCIGGEGGSEGDLGVDPWIPWIAAPLSLVKEAVTTGTLGSTIEKFDSENHETAHLQGPPGCFHHIQCAKRKIFDFRFLVFDRIT